MGEPAAVHLGTRAGRAAHPAVHRRVQLRLRVHGPERAAGDHPAYRPHLPHPHAGPQHEAGRGARRAGRHRQDGDRQGPRQGSRPALCGDELRRGHGLQGEGMGRACEGMDYKVRAWGGHGLQGEGMGRACEGMDYKVRAWGGHGLQGEGMGMACEGMDYKVRAWGGHGLQGEGMGRACEGKDYKVRALGGHGLQGEGMDYKVRAWGGHVRAWTTR